MIKIEFGYGWKDTCVNPATEEEFFTYLESDDFAVHQQELIKANQARFLMRCSIEGNRWGIPGCSQGASDE